MCNFGQKHELQYLDKICCVKSEFQILYAVEQFSSLFSKDKLKHGAHIHKTHDPPSPRSSWMYGHCRAVPSQQLSHECVVWRCHLKHSPRQERDFIHGFSPVTDPWLCHSDKPKWGRNSCPWLPLPAWYGCAYAWGNGCGLVYVCPLP